MDLASGDIIGLDNQGKYLEKAFNIALMRKITTHDALFISLAKDRRLEFVTCDKKQEKASGDEGMRTRPSPNFSFIAQQALSIYR